MYSLSYICQLKHQLNVGIKEHPQRVYVVQIVDVKICSDPPKNNNNNNKTTTTTNNKSINLQTNKKLNVIAGKQQQQEVHNKNIKIKWKKESMNG